MPVVAPGYRYAQVATTLRHSAFGSRGSHAGGLGVPIPIDRFLTGSGWPVESILSRTEYMDRPISPGG